MRYIVTFYRPSKPGLGESEPVVVEARSVEGAICKVLGVKRLGGQPLEPVAGMPYTYRRFVPSWGAVIYYRVVLVR